MNTKNPVNRSSFENLLIISYLSPDGIQEMNNKISGIVDSSCNLGELFIERDELVITYEIRASLDSKREYIFEKINMIANIIGGKAESFFPYPGWEVKSDSKLREIATKVYKRMFSDEPNVTAVHAGLECGCLLEERQDLDAISIGPNAWGFHSPSERASISSTLKVWEYLKKVLLDIK